MMGRRLNHKEKVKLTQMYKLYTHIGHEVLTLNKCFLRFGSKAMYGCSVAPKPLFVIGPLGCYSADEVEAAIYGR